MQENANEGNTKDYRNNERQYKSIIEKNAKKESDSFITFDCAFRIPITNIGKSV